MFEGQPKGLYALALANTGERFGYYTMLAIFTLFLQAKFGFTAATTSTIFASFLAGVYFMPLIGGILADKFGYGKMVTTGIVIMFAGYVLLAIPMATNIGLYSMFGALALIALGTGLFKGNLQVMVGNLYDAPEYSAKRDTAFSLFYMAINIGALFAPTAATAMTNYVLGKAGFSYVPQIPSLAHQFLDGTITAEGEATLTAMQSAQNFTGSMADFCTTYIDKLSEAYNYGFGVACISLVASMAIYVIFRSTFKHADYNSKQAKPANVHEEELTPAQTKERIVALLLVFAVVIFFWMAFHQNGLTMTFFARDYTAHEVTGLDRLGFSVWNLALLIVTVYAGFSLFQSKTGKGKLISGVIATLALVVLGVNYGTMDPTLPILPQIFQQFNPFFVVALTPVSLAVFGSLAKKGKEPSAPRKIGIGMVIAAVGFMLLAFGSFGLPTPAEVEANGIAESALVSPNWLISTYLVLTFAELFLSPMGISFVSKVAPPKYKGAMMGLWFVATAIGNYLVAIIGYLWGDMQLWIHPFMPFITEEIYLALVPEEESLMMSSWPVYKEEWNFPADENVMEHIKAITKGIRNVRAEMDVPNSRKTKVYVVCQDEALCNGIEGMTESVKPLMNANEIIIEQTKEGVADNAVSVVVPDAVVYLPLEDLVDFEQELERLKKEEDRLNKEIKRAEGMLANERFVSKAPADKVQAERDKLEKYTEMLAQVKERMEGLGK